MLKQYSVASQFVRFFVVFACFFAARNANAEDAPPFPSDPNAWINSGPLTVTGLKGKGIVLWFFDEESPKCRDRWPAMQAAAKKFDGEPVVFIAVNSGTPRGQLEGYLRELNVNWPVIVDTARDFEKACQMIQEINVENESQMRYIKPSGEIQAGLTDDIEDVAKKAAEGAEWKLSPVGMPESIKATWLAVEIGNYKGLAGSLKKLMASPKADVKDTATRLMAVVQQEMTDQMAVIKEAQESGNMYKAYENVNGFSDRFMGFEMPKDIATLKKDLAKDAKVKAGMTAAKSLETARKQLASGSKNKAQDKAIKSLEKIVADFPETSLARQAQALIDYAK